MIEPLAGQTLPALPFVVCDSAGRILRSGSCPAEMVLLQAGEGERAFAGNADGSTQYILGLDLAPAAVARPVSPVTIDKTTVAADGTDAVVVSSIGVGAAISIAGPVPSEGTGDGTDLHITFEQAGRYTITVRRFPDLDFVATVNAA